MNCLPSTAALSWENPLELFQQPFATRAFVFFLPQVYTTRSVQVWMLHCMVTSGYRLHIDDHKNLEWSPIYVHGMSLDVGCCQRKKVQGNTLPVFELSYIKHNHVCKDCIPSMIFSLYLKILGPSIISGDTHISPM